MAGKINLVEKLAGFDDHWSPKIVARYNDSDIMVVKVLGEFVWHHHDDTDDFFLVLKGRLTIETEDGDVTLAPGEIYVVPGPTILLVVSCALALTGGVVLGDLIAMSVTLAGLGIILAASAAAFAAMKWAGALYLAWMGWRMIRESGSAATSLQTLERRRGGKAFRDGFVVTLLNPKSIGFFIAFVSQFVDATRPVTPQFLLMIVTFVGLGGINVLVYAMLAARLRDRLTRPGAMAWLQRICGGVLIGLAAFTLTLRRAA